MALQVLVDQGSYVFWNWFVMRYSVVYQQLLSMHRNSQRGRAETKAVDVRSVACPHCQE